MRANRLGRILLANALWWGVPDLSGAVFARQWANPNKFACACAPGAGGTPGLYCPYDSWFANSILVSLSVPCGGGGGERSVVIVRGFVNNLDNYLELALDLSERPLNLFEMVERLSWRSGYRLRGNPFAIARVPTAVERPS